MVLNLENKGRMQDKEMGKNVLAHRWCLIYATMLLGLEDTQRQLNPEAR